MLPTWYIYFLFIALRTFHFQYLIVLHCANVLLVYLTRVQAGYAQLIDYCIFLFEGNSALKRKSYISFYFVICFKIIYWRKCCRRDTSISCLLPPANEVWGKVIFSQACVKNCVNRRGGDACSGGGCLVRGGAGACSGGSGPRGGLLGGVWSGPGGGASPGSHPRGKMWGIRSRPTPKGEIEGDQVQAHTQGGNWRGSGPAPPPRQLLLRAVCILLIDNTNNYLLLPPTTEVWGKVMFLHLFVILFIGGPVGRPGRGGQTPLDADPHLGRLPLGRPPWMQTPWDADPPRCRPPSQDTSTSGRYASYWNAYLFS